MAPAGGGALGVVSVDGGDGRELAEGEEREGEREEAAH